MDPALRWRKPRSADSSASVRLGHYPPSVLTVWHQIEGHPIIAVIFWLANDGHDTRTVQHYLGHKNIQHTVRYTELSPAREADACPFSVIVMQQLPRLYYEMDRFHSE